MSTIVRQSTAVELDLGPVLDADGVAVTNVAVGDLRLAKKDADPATLSGSATLTHRHTGNYTLNLSAGDTNTVGKGTVTLNKTTDAMSAVRFQVVEQAIYDALYASGATGLLPANVTQLDGSAIVQDSGVLSANVTGWAGSTATVSGGYPDVNSISISGSTAAADALEVNYTGTITNFDALDTAQDTQHATTQGAISTAQADLDTITDTGVVATNALNAAGVRSAVGLASANLDTQLSAIDSAIAALNDYDGSDPSGVTTLLSRLTSIRAGLLDNLDAAVSTRLADADYTAPDNASIAAILVDTGTTLPARLDGIQGATFDTSTDSLEAIRNAVGGISSGGGSGAFAITVTVTDGTDPLENATVRVTEGADTFALSTNASGQAQFSLDAATYTVSITKSGYTFTPTTRTVTANETGTITNDLEMTQIAVTPSVAGKATGYTTVLDHEGNAEENVTISVQCVAVPTGSGSVLDSKVRTAVTDVNGYVEFTNQIKGATYTYRRGSSPNALQYTIPSDAEATVEIDNFLGADE